MKERDGETSRAEVAHDETEHRRYADHDQQTSDTRPRHTRQPRCVRVDARVVRVHDGAGHALVLGSRAWAPEASVRWPGVSSQPAAGSAKPSNEANTATDHRSAPARAWSSRTCTADAPASQSLEVPGRSCKKTMTGRRPGDPGGR